MTSPSIRNATIPVGALKAHPRNYRRHPEQQIGRLAASVARFGQVRSIVVQEGTRGKYLIVAGHGLAEAAKTQGLTELRADIIPASWTAEQVEGYLIADNETARLADDDQELLAAMLQEQANAGYHLESLGYDRSELDALLEELTQNALSGSQHDVDDPDGGGDDFDTTPDASGPTRVQAGDLWQLGEHRLLCGDSTKREDVARLMDGERDALLLTDPPYGINLNSEWQNAVHRKHGKALNYNADSIANDNGEIAAEMFTGWPRRVVFGFPYLHDTAATGWLVWDKEPGFEGRSLTSPVEMAYSTTWRGFRIERLLWSGYMREAGSEAKVGHPTQKPLRLLTAIIEQHTDATVVDPYLGSGTTLIACERLKRRCYGIEIDPRYCDVILRRWEAETGREATLLERTAQEVSDGAA